MPNVHMNDESHKGFTSLSFVIGAAAPVAPWFLENRFVQVPMLRLRAVACIVGNACSGWPEQDAHLA
jgi:hypothetical protein